MRPERPPHGLKAAAKFGQAAARDAAYPAHGVFFFQRDACSSRHAVHHDAQFVRRLGVLGDHLVGDRAGKAAVAALGVEAEQVVAVGAGLADPQFADRAAVGQRLMHIRSPCRHFHRRAFAFPAGASESVRRAGSMYMVQCSVNATLRVPRPEP